MMKKKIIITVAVCILATALAAAIVISIGGEAKPFPPQNMQNPVLSATGDAETSEESVNAGSSDTATRPAGAETAASEETLPAGDAAPDAPTETSEPTGTMGVEYQGSHEAIATQENNAPSAPLSTKEDNTTTSSRQEPENQPGTYKVTFVDCDNTVLSLQTVKEGQSVIPPMPPGHDGTMFIRWDTILTDIRSDRTIKAVYREISAPAIALENLYIDASQKTVTVKVSLYNNPGLSSLFFNISYPTGLTLQKIEFDERFGEYVTAPEPYGNPQSISMISPFSDITDSGVFATLTFSISDAENRSQLTVGISCDQDNIFNSSFEEVGVTALEGTITRIK